MEFANFKEWERFLRSESLMLQRNHDARKKQEAKDLQHAKRYVGMYLKDDRVKRKHNSSYSVFCKKAAHKAVRKSEIVNGAYYKRIYDYQWTIS